MGRNAAADLRRRHERREEILSVATRVFTSAGAASAVDVIARRLGISKGTIYLYFPAKDDLLAEVATRAHENHLGRMRQIASGPGTPAERLRLLLKTSILLVDEQRLLLRMLMDSPQSIRLGIRRHWARPARGLYVALLAEGIKSGAFLPHDPEVIAHCAISLARGVYFYEGRPSVEEFADDTAQLLVRSISAPASGTPRALKKKKAR
jgi:AcrR family transcriptional regulator